MRTIRRAKPASRQCKDTWDEKGCQRHSTITTDNDTHLVLILVILVLIVTRRSWRREKVEEGFCRMRLADEAGAVGV